MCDILIPSNISEIFAKLLKIFEKSLASFGDLQQS